MRFWFDSDVKSNGGGTNLYGSPAHLEVEEQSDDDDGASYTYIAPLSPSDFLVISCWNHQFDGMAPYIFDEAMGDNWVSAYGEAWPTFEILIRNALLNRYSSGALVNVDDPDDGERKWCVVSFVGNTMPKESYDEVIQDQRVLEGCQRVYLHSVQLLQEMSSGRDMSFSTKAKLMGKGAFLGYKRGIETSSVWLDHLSAILGN